MQRLVVRVAAVAFVGGDDCRWCYEPCDAAFQPDHLLYTKIISEELLELFACEPAIALLHFTQQALFGGDERTVAVDIDAAAFEDDPLATAIDDCFRLPGRHMQPLRDFCRD